LTAKYSLYFIGDNEPLDENKILKEYDERLAKEKYQLKLKPEEDKKKKFTGDDFD
jgi:hypothetical protein